MRKIVFYLIIIMILFSCRKEKESVLFKGNVTDQTTKLPIEGIKIILWGSYSGLFGGGPSDMLAQTYTDNNGSFIIDTEFKLKDYDMYSIGARDETNSSDTTRIGYHYFFDHANSPNISVYAVSLKDIPRELNFMLCPSGVIEFRTYYLRGNKLYDTIMIKSQYGSDTLYDFDEKQLSFPPNKTYSFEISNLVNNKIDKTIIKEIYIPNYYSRHSLLGYDIKFDD